MEEKKIIQVLFKLWCWANIISGVMAIVFYFFTKLIFALVVGCGVIILFTYFLTSKRINKIFK